MARSEDPSAASPSSPAPVEPNAGELAFATLRKHFEKLRENEAATRLGTDPEALHDMRVATRRLRAALSLFGEVLPRRAEGLRRRLGWLGRTLGGVRDLDVLLETLAAEFANEPALAAAAAVLGRDLTRRRETARRRMLRTLDSRRYARLLESFARFLEAGPPRRRALALEPASVVAPDRLAWRFKKVRKLGERLTPEATAERFHAMRIRAKRLRYAVEFHRELYGAAAEGVIERLVAIQDHLGTHQDCQVLLARIEALHARLGARPAAAVAFGLGALAERTASRAAALRRAFPRLYRGLRGKPWKRLKSTMEKRRLAAVRRRRAPHAPRPAPPDDTLESPPERRGDPTWTTRPRSRFLSTRPLPSSTAS